jgi:hypothetical protein
MAESKRCPYCAEDIRSAALRCPHCRSRLTGFEAAEWHRDHADARVAGVASALAQAAVFHLFGVFAYAALWAVIPPAKGQRSVLERALSRAQTWAKSAAAGAREKTPATTGAPSGPGEMSSAAAGVIHDGSDGDR